MGKRVGWVSARLSVAGPDHVTDVTCHHSTFFGFSSQLYFNFAILHYLLSWMFKVHRVDKVTLKQLSITEGCVDDKRIWGVLIIQLYKAAWENIQNQNFSEVLLDGILIVSCIELLRRYEIGKKGISLWWKNLRILQVNTKNRRFVQTGKIRNLVNVCKLLQCNCTNQVNYVSETGVQKVGAFKFGNSSHSVSWKTNWNTKSWKKKSIML